MRSKNNYRFYSLPLKMRNAINMQNRILFSVFPTGRGNSTINRERCDQSEFAEAYMKGVREYIVLHSKSCILGADTGTEKDNRKKMLRPLRNLFVTCLRCIAPLIWCVTSYPIFIRSCLPCRKKKNRNKVLQGVG